MQCNILAPKNTDVDEVNNAILESISKESHTYLNANSLAPTEEGASVAAGVSVDSLYPVEFLNTLQFNGIANHELQLKVGVPILLLRNLNQSIGLCNGTKLIVKRLGQRVIEAEIITGNNVGKRVFIPRIIMSPSGTDWPFVLRRRQFLVRVAFVCHIVALAIYIKKKNYGYSNIPPCKNLIFQKIYKKKKNPSRYHDSIITNLKFQHKPKYHV